MWSWYQRWTQAVPFMLSGCVPDLAVFLQFVTVAQPGPPQKANSVQRTLHHCGHSWLFYIRHCPLHHINKETTNKLLGDLLHTCCIPAGSAHRAKPSPLLTLPRCEAIRSGILSQKLVKTQVVRAGCVVAVVLCTGINV